MSLSGTLACVAAHCCTLLMTYMGIHCHGNNADPFKYAMFIHVTQTLMAACCCIQLDGATRRIIAFSSLMARAFVERQNILQHDTNICC